MSEESESRREVQRMVSFLEAETGPLGNRVLGVIALDSPSPLEQRFLNRILTLRPTELRWYGSLDGAPAGVKTVNQYDVLLQDASGVVVIGQGGGTIPDLEDALVNARQRVVAASNARITAPENASFRMVQLERELREDELERLERQQRMDQARNIWIISISLMVTIIGISNALLMSVTERFREIGTMKCLGALSSFIRQIFFIESALTGLAGSIVGAILGFFISYMIYSITFGFGLVTASLAPGTLIFYLIISLIGGILMSIIAAIYPATFASRMVPATALRTNI
jgi:predicted lysophospholipase L1 biosynthesis ABC-type transport system permease subunit